MSETRTGNRNNGWIWAVGVLVVLVTILACAFSMLGAGLVGYAIGRGSTRYAETRDYSYEEPWPFPYEFQPEMPYGLDSRAWLGVGFVTGDEGALVTSVISDSPAESAGIQVEDVITEVDGELVTPDTPLDEHILSYNPGDRVEITLLRNGRERVVSVRLGSRSDSGLEGYEDGFPVPQPLIPDMKG